MPKINPSVGQHNVFTANVAQQPARGLIGANGRSGDPGAALRERAAFNGYLAGSGQVAPQDPQFAMANAWRSFGRPGADDFDPAGWLKAHQGGLLGTAEPTWFAPYAEAQGWGPDNLPTDVPFAVAEQYLDTFDPWRQTYQRGRNPAPGHSVDVRPRYNPATAVDNWYAGGGQPGPMTGGQAPANTGLSQTQAMSDWLQNLLGSGQQPAPPPPAFANRGPFGF